jgi:Uma2 family endonuclease
MGLPKLKPSISVEDYLEGKKISEVRHEYLDGEVYAVSGASKRHNRISINLLARLLNHLKGSDCEIFFSRM